MDTSSKPEIVNHPPHYGKGTYEVYKVLEAWGLLNNVCLWQAVKYIARAGKKGSRRRREALRVEDLKKAQWYLDKEITRLSRSG